MSEAAVHFRKVAERLKASGALDPKVLNVDTNTLLYQVPGGMLSNLISQLKQAGKEDKYYDVLAEIPRVREDFGYPPLVTPSSQIVGTQAVMNVILGERYKMVPRRNPRLCCGASTASCPARSTRKSGPRRASSRRMSSPVVPPTFWSRASQVPRGVQGHRQERGGRALLSRCSRRSHPSSSTAATCARRSRTACWPPSCIREARARRRTVLPQVNRSEKSPFQMEGRFSYFVRSSCICTCGMPSSKNSSDVWRKPKSSYSFFT